MMSEMVERVARAMFEACYGDTHTAGWTRAENKPTDASDDLKERFRRLARAAIEAMKEPTEAMIDAGGSVEVARGDRNEEVGDYIAERVWPAMSAAALGEA